MKITVLDGHTLNPGDNPWTPIESLGEFTVYPRTPIDKIVERAGDSEILLTNKCPLSAKTLAQLPKLKFIAVLATGYNTVDTAYCAEHGIIVSNVPVYSTDAVAEFVFALILNFYKRTEHHNRLVHQGDWQNCEDFSFWDNPDFHEISGKTIGIIGFGRIGQRTAALAHAFGMKVLGHSRSQSATTDFPFKWASVEEILSESDVISLHCPLTPESEGMINAQTFAQMKPSAFFINTSRGPLVDEQALTNALNHGEIAGAACDVVSKEPISAENPLLNAKNLTITPHIAWAAIETRQRMMQITAENISAFLQNDPINTV